MARKRKKIVCPPSESPVYVNTEPYGRLPVNFWQKPLRVLCHVMMNGRCFFSLYFFPKYALMMDNNWTDAITRIQKYIWTWLIVDSLSSNTIIIQIRHDYAMTNDWAFHYRLKPCCYLKKSDDVKRISSLYNYFWLYTMWSISNKLSFGDFVN